MTAVIRDTFADLMELKVRYVRTPEGARYYGQPIGTPIKEDQRFYEREDPQTTLRLIEQQLLSAPRGEGILYHSTMDRLSEDRPEFGDQTRGITLTEDPVDAVEYLRGSPGTLYAFGLAEDARIATPHDGLRVAMEIWPDRVQREQTWGPDSAWDEDTMRRLAEAPMVLDELKKRGFHGLRLREAPYRTRVTTGARRSTVWIWDQRVLRAVEGEPTPDEYGVLPPRAGAKFEVLPEKERGASGDGRFGSTRKWGKFGAAGVLIRLEDPEGGPARYVLVQRGPAVSHHKGKWQLPGGALFERENPYQGATREAMEEIKLSRFFLPAMKPEGEHVFDEGDGWQYTTLLSTMTLPDRRTYFDFVDSLRVDGGETSDFKLATAPEVMAMIERGEITPSLAQSLAGFIERMEGGGHYSTREGVLRGDFRGLKRVGGQQGSHEGGLYQAHDGSKWYIKAAPSREHGAAEVLANDLYRLAEVGDGAMPVSVLSAEGQGVEDLGSTQVASEWYDNAEPFREDMITGRDWRSMIDRLQQDFAADAWLGNWDVAGTGWSNIILTGTGRPLRIDQGGALMYRALGAPKGSAWGPEVHEWQTLRDPSRGRYTAPIFGPMTLDELSDSVHKLVAAVTDEAIRERVAAHGFSPSVAETLIARRDDIVMRLRAEAAEQRRVRIRGSDTGDFDSRLEKATHGDEGLRTVPWRHYDRTSNLAMYRLVAPVAIGRPSASSGYYEHGQFQNMLSALGWYQGSGHEEINAWLRGGPQPDNADQAWERVRLIDDALQYSVLDRDVVAYRGVNPEGMSEALGVVLEDLDDVVVPGLTFRDLALGSTSTDEKIAAKFAGTHLHRPGYVFRMILPKGSHAIGLSSKDDEAELLLERDITYRVVRVHEVDEVQFGFGTRKIKMVDVELEFNYDPDNPRLPTVEYFDDEDDDDIFYDEDGPYTIDDPEEVG